MGGALDAIEQEEQKLRVTEERADILACLDEIEDLETPEGQEAYEDLVERLEATFGPKDAESGTTDADTMYIDLPWECESSKEVSQQIK